MNPTTVLSAAAQAAGAQDFPPGTLYVVATPIGNLADITLRAVHTLSLVDAVACEDTRQSAHLLQSLGLHKPLMAVHEHNEREGAQRVVERLSRGERVAYVSDAGTPAVSDPGAALVHAVRTAGFRCLPLPGASVTWVKQRRLALAAQHFLLRWPSPPPCRFDVVAVEGQALHWWPAAFDVTA